MELTIYDIIKSPIISDKAYKLNKNLNKLVLKVHLDANKPMIKSALEKLFNIKVEKINIMRRKGKSFMVKRKAYQKSEVKKAIITLAEGYTLNLFEQSEVNKAPVEPANK